MIFERMRVWPDPVRRPGPEAMAVDEWLLGEADKPDLRVYGWLGDWCSLGYFGNLAAAESELPSANWVRRMTGGGVVDHRADWTYSLIIPAAEPAASWKGAEGYRRIHAALVSALRKEGHDVRLCGAESESGHPLCFKNPVSHDVVDATGGKIAGAGQRRSRMGLLHQGSVALPCLAQASSLRAANFAAALSPVIESENFHPMDCPSFEEMIGRYRSDAWLTRR
jgi:lipoate-protein ligase A